MEKVYNPYMAQLSGMIQGNTISRENLQSVRGHVICDITQQSSVEIAHANEVNDILSVAQNAYMYSDGTWMVGCEDPHRPRYGTNNPQDLYKLQAERSAYYKQSDSHSRICLFANIYEADKECSERNLFETHNNGFVVGRADLITSDVTDVLCDNFGNEYYRFVQKRVEEQKAVERAKQTMERDKKKKEKQPIPTTGINIDGMSSYELQKYLAEHPEIEGNSENLDKASIMRQRAQEISDVQDKNAQINKRMYDLMMQWDADGTFAADAKRSKTNHNSDDFELQ